MGLETFIRFGYFLLILTMLLMIWSSLAGAREMEIIKYPPCTFNPLCTCSKPVPDLGIVQCRNVPFPAIPQAVNNSKVFMLHMENTGLREFEPYFLQATGLYRLDISHNPLTEVPDDSFIGLERSLWELILTHNELIDIPSRAIRHLQKLRHLDLSGNQISCIEVESFRGLEDSLQTLILSKNSINSIPPDSFSTLPLLDTIDLSGNNIAKIDPNIFRDGMPRLVKLILSDNILTEIPYIALSPLKQLRILDLSYNLIAKIEIDEYNETKPVASLTLDNLHIEYNLIEMIPTGAFQNFALINKTYLDGNPLSMLGDEAFRPAKIRELYIRHCKLHIISPLSFEGLGNSLQILDLSGNNITNLPENIFSNFDVFRALNIRDNKINQLMPIEMFNGFQFTLIKLDLSGEKNNAVNLQDLRRLRNMRSLSLSRLSSANLAPDDFVEYGLELEDLKITRSNLKTIKAHAFTHIRGIKRLDLSENKINQIENDAFTEIGHSLISLKISNGLSGSLGSIPADVMRPLTSLQEMDLSNNQLKTIGDTCFHFMKNLRVLALHDNRIDQIVKGTFQGDIHSNLQILSLSFNNIKHITQHTFVDLEALRRLHLDDNRIEHIERRAFMNLDRLRHISLRGNKLISIADEAFQIYEGDSLPDHICKECVEDVEKYFQKIQRCNQLERKWCDKLKEHDLSNHYLQVIKIVEIYSNKAKSRIEEITPKQSSISRYNILNSRNTSSNILKNLLLNRHIYKVKSLQQICLDFFNINGPDLLDTILKIKECENSNGEDSDSNCTTFNEAPSIPPPPPPPEELQLQQQLSNDPFNVIKKHSKKKKKRNPVRDYINSRRKRKYLANLKRTSSPASTSDGKTLVTNAYGVKDELKDKKCLTKKSNTHSTSPLVALELENSHIGNEDSSECKQKTSKVEEQPMPKNDQPRLSLEYLRTVSPDNVITGKRMRSRPIRLSDQIHENTLAKKREKIIGKIEKHRLRIESESDKDKLEISLKVNDEDEEITDNLNKKKMINLPQTKKINSSHVPIGIGQISKAKTESINNKRLTESPPVVVPIKRSVISPSTVSRPVKKDNTSIDEENETKSIIEKSKKYKSPKDYIKHIANTKPRAKARINYSEALVDEALMYEEILMDKEAKEQLVIATTIEASKQDKYVMRKGKNDFSFDFDESPQKNTLEKKFSGNGINSDVETRLSEISIMPIKRQNITKTDLSVNPINVTLSDITSTFKTNPELIFNISSAVSIQLKSSVRSESSESGSIIGDSLQRCKYCEQSFGNIKKLAIHQLDHLQIVTHKVGDVQILDPKFRRGRMVPMGTQKCFRCLNCWRLHPNSQSILEHWVIGKCLFYCTICGESFHTNPKLIREHFPQAHDIKFKLPDEFLPKEMDVSSDTLSNGLKRKRPPPPSIIKIEKGVPINSKLRPIVQKSGRVTCEICSCSFPNMQSRNSHMRLHKHDRIGKPIPGTYTNVRPFGNQPTRSNQFPPSTRPSFLRNAQAAGPRYPPMQGGKSNQKPQFRISQAVTVNRKPVSSQTTRANQSQPIRNQSQTVKSPEYSQPYKTEQKDQSPDRYQPQINLMDYSLIDVKTEITDDYSEYSNSLEYSSDYNNSVDFTPEPMDDYNNIVPTQSDVTPVNSPTIVKSEQNVMPRLQVKKLHELQEPNYATSSSTYYRPGQSVPMQQQMQSQTQTQGPMAQYQIAPPPHIMQVSSPPLQPIQLQSQPQFQISQVQQVQNTQYYNPVFVVQPTQPPQPPHQMPPQQNEMYPYSNDQMDYGKYYS